MAAARIFWLLLTLWLVFFVLSFVVFFTTEPTGDGFTRGMNRITGFIGWQGGAGAIGVLVWFRGRGFEKGTLQRWMSIVPLLCAILLVFALVAVVLLARIAG